MACNNIFFDLDGTLTDSGEGIINSVRYALESFGISEPDDGKLRRFLGPPLGQSFIDFYGFSEADAKTAVAKYREYFAPKGIFENRMYDGVPEMLDRLRAAGKRLFIASAKPTVFCRKVTDYFEITSCFAAVQGAELADIDISKAAILGRMLARYGVAPETAVMVGDRKFDVGAGVQNGVPTVAAAYGYGPPEEFKTADYIASSVAELTEILLTI